MYFLDFYISSVMFNVYVGDGMKILKIKQKKQILRIALETAPGDNRSQVKFHS